MNVRRSPVLGCLIVFCVVTGLPSVLRADDRSDLLQLFQRAGQLVGENKLAEAAKLYEQALQLAPRVVGEKSLEVATLQSNLGEIYQNLNQVDKAVPLFRSALAIHEAKLGEGHPVTATTLVNLANVLSDQGQYEKAEPLLQRALRTREASLGKDHPLTARTIGSLANLAASTGQTAQAETLYLRSIALLEAKLGKDDLLPAAVTNNLANLYAGLGLIAKAEPLYQQALKTFEAKLGKDNVGTARPVNNLANFYASLGQYDQAEPLYLRALAIFETQTGKDSAFTAVAVLNLANLYFNTKRYDQAEPLYLRALAIFETALGKDHTFTSRTVGNLANLYKEQKRFAKAEPLYNRARASCVTVLGADHYETALMVRNLAEFYTVAGRFADAEPLHVSAIDTLIKKVGSDHPNTAVCISSYARLLAATARFPDAVRTEDRAMRSTRRYTSDVLPILGDREQLTFLRASHDVELARGLSLGLEPELSAENRSRVASWLVNGKAVASESLAAQILTARSADTVASRAALAELETVRRRIARLAQQTDRAPDRAALDALKETERRLAVSLSAFDTRTRRDDPWSELDEVRQRLPESGVLIDVSRFPVYDFKGQKSGADHYVAFLSFRTAETRVVDLGPAAAIDAAVKAVRKELDGAAKAIVAKGEPAAEKALQESLAALGKLVLTPIRPHVGDKSQWVVSPDSNLWLVPWSILPLDDKTYAVEKHTVRYVVSGRDLLTGPPMGARKTTAPVIVADPDFDQVGPKGAANPSLRRGLSKDFVLGNIQRLPGTAIEAEAVMPRLKKLYGVEPKLFTETTATAAAVRGAKSPSVLVLSTHGYFLEDEKIDQTVSVAGADARASGRVAENPLLRCGLLLAGCNKAANAKPGEETGVLTGLEIVGCDLRGTQMVVLSACETGLGEVQNGQGVAGLRQAFQLAGAESVVATLWQIPDVQSAQLMVGFFDQLNRKLPRDEALRAAQLEQIKNRRDRFGAAHPYFWAAYTVTGNVN